MRMRRPYAHLLKFFFIALSTFSMVGMADTESAKVEGHVECYDFAGKNCAIF
jgi:hypothetical protein